MSLARAVKNHCGRNAGRSLLSAREFFHGGVVEPGGSAPVTLCLVYAGELHGDQEIFRKQAVKLLQQCASLGVFLLALIASDQNDLRIHARIVPLLARPLQFLDSAFSVAM